MLCGFSGLPQSNVTSLEVLPPADHDSGRQRHASVVNGGWGYAGFLSHGSLQLHCGQSTVSLNSASESCKALPDISPHHAALALQQFFTSPPEGSVAAAALGWQQVTAVSDSGNLYQCDLPSIQPAEIAEGCSDAEHPARHSPMKWSNLPLSKPVKAVAAGKHHR